MDLTHIYNQFKLIEENLLPYGFTKQDDEYILTKMILNNTMYANFKITKDIINVDVYDAYDNELYLPFNINNAKGAFINTVKDSVASHLADILKNCFEETNVKELINQYIKEKYNIDPVYIFEKERYAFKLNNKWFGFVMKIKYQQLGIDKNGFVDIINVKLDPDEINQLIDNKYYFKAYHMNKKYWLTIMLSASLELNKITEYIDKSYHIIETK